MGSAAVTGAVRELAAIRLPAVGLVVLAIVLTDGSDPAVAFWWLAAAGAAYAAASLWLVYVRRLSLPWFAWLAVDAALLAGLAYASGGADSPMRPLFLLLPIAGVISYSPAFTAVVGAASTLVYLVVGAAHSAIEGGPGAGSIVAFAMFIALAAIASTLPVSAVVQRQRRQAVLEERAERARVEALAEVAGRLQSITDAALAGVALDDVLQEVLTAIGDAVGADGATVFLLEENGTPALRAVATKGVTSASVGDLVAIGDGPAGRVAADRKPLIATRTDGELRSKLAVPLAVGARLVGVLQLGKRAPGGYDEADVHLLQLAGDRVALGIDRARLYERERHMAATLQRSLLPDRLPDVPGTQAAARYIPAGEESQIGGDWYDVIDLPGTGIGLAMGDVVSHGARAAAVMAQLRSALRAYALDHDSPAAVLERLDRLLRNVDPQEMATLVYLVLEPETGALRYANAGHPPPLVIDAAGGTRFIEGARSVPLGAVVDPHYDEGSAELPPGSTLLLYTDGLVERRGASISDGLARLAVEAAKPARGPGALCDDVVDALLGGVAPEDDVAVLTVQAAPLAPGRLTLELPAKPAVLPSIRRALRQWLAGIGASTREIHDIQVAVTEAAANAVEHAYGPGDATFGVEVAATNGSVEIVVRDSGAWRDPRGSGRGRGILLMRALTNELELSRGSDGTRVRMRCRLGARAPA